MSGTGGSIVTGGGLYIPTPRVMRHPAGIDAGLHDKLSVGWMQSAEYEALKERQPEIWLFRYKRGYNPNLLPHTGTTFQDRAGWAHPSDISAGALSGRSYSGGAHSARNGATIDPRQSEWLVTRSEFYDALFDPNDWFKNRDTKPYVYPIQPIGTGSGDEGISALGQSGQGVNDAGSLNPSNLIACGNARGIQVQYFAFAFAVRDENDTRNRIIGPMTTPFKAEIWPKVKTTFTCPPTSDRGRKIRIIAK